MKKNISFIACLEDLVPYKPLTADEPIQTPIPDGIRALDSNWTSSTPISKIDIVDAILQKAKLGGNPTILLDEEVYKYIQNTKMEEEHKNIEATIMSFILQFGINIIK